jgi:hypothetical protein
VVDIRRQREQHLAVLGIVAGSVDVAAREAADGIHRVPERGEHELRAAVRHPPLDQHAAVSRRGAGASQPRPAQVGGVALRILRARFAAPDPRDHASRSVSRPATRGGFRTGTGAGSGVPRTATYILKERRAQL